MDPRTLFVAANGIAILRRDARGRYATACLKHHTVEAWDRAALVALAADHPEDWCAQCRQDADEAEPTGHAGTPGK